MEKLVDGFPHYKVTDDERIFSRYSSRSSYVDAASPWTEIFPSKEKSGYMVVTLVHKSFVQKKRVHRLIAEAFIPNPENKKEVNHKDGIKTNNIMSNLEWRTRSENAQHAFDQGLEKMTFETAKKISASNLKLTLQEEKEIIDLYKTGEYSIRQLTKKLNHSHHIIRHVIDGTYHTQIKKTPESKHPIDVAFWKTYGKSIWEIGR